MTRRAPVLVVPDEAVELVRSIVDAENGFWDTLRELNRGDREGTRRATGTDIGDILARDDAKSAACERLRKKYFPRAARVTVDIWGDVYTWSPTGRVVRKVWSLPAPRVGQ
jgi:hypothetical protein